MGCYNNVNIFNEVLSVAKKDKGMVAIQVDIAKAFDTLPHATIKGALKNKGMPNEVIALVMDSYKDAKTTIKCSGQLIEVELKRGVKQGDPLSPLIFNMCMDSIIGKLESMKGLTITAEQNISCLAFADDLILLADNAREGKAQLEELDKFLAAKGMTLAVEKCVAFEIRTTKDSWFVKDPDIYTQSGVRIPYIGPDKPLTYLGMHITPWEGVTIKQSIIELHNTLPRIKKLALKPHQKVEILARFVLPHYIYAFTLGSIDQTKLRIMDRDLRVAVKEYLHLPLSTADGLIYASKRDGGLGFPKLETTLISAMLKAGHRFALNEDPAIKALMITSGLEKKLKRLAHVARLGWPIETTKQIDAYKYKAKEDERKRWMALPSQGKGVQSYKDDKIGNEWLYRPKLLKPCRYITALKMRANVAADKVSLNRAAKTDRVTCRHCKVMPETLGHILGQCIYTKSLRIKRHNDIRDYIEKLMLKQKDMTVTTEARIDNTQPARLQPDLIIQHRERVLVVDVTVCHEDGDLLDRGRRDKVSKYATLESLKRQLGAKDFKILPIVIGTRGSMPKQTLTCLREINIENRASLRTISLMALRSSIEIYHIFMDYNATLAI